MGMRRNPRHWRLARRERSAGSLVTRGLVTVTVLGATALSVGLLSASPAAPETSNSVGSAAPAGNSGNTGASTDTTTTTAPPTTTTTTAAPTTTTTTAAPPPAAPTSGPVQAGSSDTPVTVDWTGNGAENGTCDTVSDDSIGPVPNGETGWLFILTSPFGSGPWELTTNLTNTVTDGVQQGGGGSVHFVVFAPLGAKLTSASATNGTPDPGGSVLTVSHCQPGVPLIPTTSSTTVFDATTNAPWSGTETTGATAYDTSTVSAQEQEVSGPSATAVVPPITGTVTYTFFMNGTCAGDGTQLPAVDIVDGTPGNSPTTLPLAAGSYSFDVVYNGDSNYAPSPVGDCEPFSVGPAPSSTSTVLKDAATGQDWAGTETAPASAFDTSTVSGAVIGFVPTGTVTYSFFNNGTCSGTPASTQDVLLKSDGTVPNSATTAALSAGSYSFDAVYGGDSNYSASSVSSCEPFTIAPVTSGSNVTPPATPTAPTTSPATAGATAAPATKPAVIAFTGADIAGMSAAAIALMGLGGLLVLASRRRRSRPVE